MTRLTLSEARVLHAKTQRPFSFISIGEVHLTIMSGFGCIVLADFVELSGDAIKGTVYDGSKL